MAGERSSVSFSPACISLLAVTARHCRPSTLQAVISPLGAQEWSANLNVLTLIHSRDGHYKVSPTY